MGTLRFVVLLGPRLNEVILAPAVAIGRSNNLKISLFGILFIATAQSNISNIG